MRNRHVPRPYGYEPMKPATIPTPRVSAEQIAAVRARTLREPDGARLVDVMGLAEMEATA